MRLRQSALYRCSSFRNPLMLPRLHSGFNVVENFFWIFGTRVVIRDDHNVSSSFGRLSHLGSFSAIPIAPAAKDENQSAVGERPDRSEGAADCIRRMRIVS